MSTQENILQFTDQELSIIIQGLGELPMKFSGPVMGKIQRFLLAQNQQQISLTPILQTDSAQVAITALVD